MMNLVGIIGTGYPGLTPYGNPRMSTFVTGTGPLQVQSTPTLGVPKVYYSNGFLPSGANQVTGGGLLTTLGNIVGGIFHGITGTQSTATVPMSTASTVPMVSPARVGGVIQKVAGAITTAATQHPVLTAAGGAAATAGAVMMAGGAMHLGGHARYAPPGTRGYHMIKRGPHAGQWTRNRHRNVANIRALRRAMSRLHGFERVCRKVVHFVSPHKRGRPVFRRRRRAK